MSSQDSRSCMANNKDDHVGQGVLARSCRSFHECVPRTSPTCCRALPMLLWRAANLNFCCGSLLTAVRTPLLHLHQHIAFGCQKPRPHLIRDDSPDPHQTLMRNITPLQCTDGKYADRPCNWQKNATKLDLEHRPSNLQIADAIKKDD